MDSLDTDGLLRTSRGAYIIHFLILIFGRNLTMFKRRSRETQWIRWLSFPGLSQTMIQVDDRDGRSLDCHPVSLPT